MPRKRRASDPEAQAIRETVLDYILSWYTWDRPRLKRSLHPKLAKRMVWPDEKTGRSALHAYPILKLLEWVVLPSAANAMQARPRSRGERERGAKSWTGYVKILDRFEDMCVVKTEARWGIDYIQLAKWNGKWKIINVLWKFVPGAAVSRTAS